MPVDVDNGGLDVTFSGLRRRWSTAINGTIVLRKHIALNTTYHPDDLRVKSTSPNDLPKHTAKCPESHSSSEKCARCNGHCLAIGCNAVIQERGLCRDHCGGGGANVMKCVHAGCTNSVAGGRGKVCKAHSNKTDNCKYSGCSKPTVGGYHQHCQKHSDRLTASMEKGVVIKRPTHIPFLFNARSPPKQANIY